MTKEEILINHAEDEYEIFIDNVLKLDKEQIIDKAYEIATKTDILTLIQAEDYSKDSLDNLIELKNPLSCIYSRWLKVDADIMDELREVIGGFAEIIG